MHYKIPLHYSLASTYYLLEVCSPEHPLSGNLLALAAVARGGRPQAVAGHDADAAGGAHGPEVLAVGDQARVVAAGGRALHLVDG
jgi:hypothetical protein